MKLRDSLFILAIVLPVASQAAPVTYDFTVNATSGPRAGTISSGYFTYNDRAVGRWHLESDLAHYRPQFGRAGACSTRGRKARAEGSA